MSDTENPKTLLVAPKATGVLEAETIEPLFQVIPKTHHDDILDAAKAVMAMSVYRNALEGLNELRVLPDYAFIDSMPNRFGPAPRRYRNLTSSKVRTAPKIGRNESCPCGSGKKNKHCCNVAVMPGSE